MASKSESPSRSASENQSGSTAFTIVACSVAILVSLVVGVWFLSYQEFALAAPRFSSDFFDAQARSWLAGTWSMPPEVLRLEGIRTATGLQMYFGPFPSLLRLPILALTDRFDGRLVQPSLLLAYGVMITATTWLWWQIRTLVHGARPLTRLDGVVGACAIATACIGTSAISLFIATTVYLEAIAWGYALALLSFALLVSTLRSYRTVTAVGAVVAAGAAVLSRVSGGGGALVAIWLVGVVWLAARLVTGRTGRIAQALQAATGYLVPSLRSAPATGRQSALWLAGAVAGSAAYVAVNYVRFGMFASIPWEGFVVNDQSTPRAEALAANGGNLTGLRFLPTTLWTYLRPDGIEFDSRIPWITIPRRPITPIGDTVVLDVTQPTASLTAMMSLFVLLAVVGIVAVMLTRRAGAGGLGTLRLPLVGAAAGTIPMLLAAFFAHRYTVDALPLILLGAFAGFQVIWFRLITNGSRRLRIGFLSAAGLLALWGVAANLAVSVELQNLIAPRDPDVRYEFVTRQYGDDQLDLPTFDVVPPPAQRGELIVIGDCEALLWSAGNRWFVLEGTLSTAAWTPDPGTKFFDRIVAGSRERGEPVLCRQLRSG